MLTKSEEALLPWVYNSKVNLSGVVDGLAQRALEVLQILKEAGWQPVIFEAVRTVDQERIKVEEGYSHTMHSLHITGRALDIVDKRYLWEGPATSQSFGFWVALGLAAKKEGLEWGGNWSAHERDVAHIQYPVGA